MNKIKFFSLTFFLLITTIIGVNLSYADVVFIPNSLKNTTTQGRDLYILLHGCKTTADEFLLGTSPSTPLFWTINLHRYCFNV